MEPKKIFHRVGLSYFILTVVMVGVVLAFSYALAYFAPKLYSDSNIGTVVSGIALYVCAMPICWKLLRTVPSYRLRGEKWTAGRLFSSFCIGFLLMWIGALIGSIVVTIFGAAGLDMTSDISEVIMNESPWTTLVIAVIIGPILEELFFRKFLIDRIIVMGDKTAIVVSGLMFGIFHGNFQQFFFAFLLGCFLAYIYIRTGKILYTIGIHMGINFINGFVEVLIVRNLDFSGLNSGFGSGLMFMFNNFGMIGWLVLFVLLNIVLCIIGLVRLVQLFPTRKYLPGEYSTSFKKSLGIVFGKPGMWLFIAGGVGMFIYNAMV